MSERERGHPPRYLPVFINLMILGLDTRRVVIHQADKFKDNILYKQIYSFGTNVKKIILTITYKVFRKKCVFHSSLQPLPRLHIAVRDLESSQRSASAQLLLLAGLF